MRTALFGRASVTLALLCGLFANASALSAAELPAAAQWQGKYPFDGKPTFYQNAALRDAVTALVGAKRYKEMMLGWGTAAPIAADGDALLAWSCKPHDCGDNNQSTLIDGGRVSVCITEKGVSKWYVAGGKQPLAVAQQPASDGSGGCNFQTVQEARRSLAAAH